MNAENTNEPADRRPVTERRMLAGLADDLGTVFWCLLVGGAAGLAYGGIAGSTIWAVVGGAGLTLGMWLCLVVQLIHIRALLSGAGKSEPAERDAPANSAQP